MWLRTEGRRPSLPNKLKLFVMRLFLGDSATDVARAAFYRPDAGLKQYYELQEEVLRGPSGWTLGERELMFAFISAKNRCEFCVVAHSEVARRELKDAAQVHDAVVEAELGSLEPGLKATFRFLEKLSLFPWAVRTGDVEPLRVAGVSDRMIEEAVMVGVTVAAGNRLADTLGLGALNGRALRRAGAFVARFGYRAFVG